MYWSQTTNQKKQSEHHKSNIQIPNLYVDDLGTQLGQ